MDRDQITATLEKIGLASQVVVEYRGSGGQISTLKGRFMSHVKIFDLCYSDSAGQIIRNLEACTFEVSNTNRTLRLEPKRILSITQYQK